MWTALLALSSIRVPLTLDFQLSSRILEPGWEGLWQNKRRRFPRHSLCHCGDSGQNSALCLLLTADPTFKCPDASGRITGPVRSLRRYHTLTVSSEYVKMLL